MKACLIIITLFIGQEAYSQKQPAKHNQDSRIYFYPDDPAPLSLIMADLVFWPNPAFGETKVTVKNMTDQVVGSGYTMQVHSTDGRLTHQQVWSSGQLLDVSRLLEGVYIATLRRDNLVFSGKLFVKRK